MPQGGFGSTPFGGFQSGVSGVNVLTAEDIIRNAYANILITSPSAARLATGLMALDNLLASWFTQRLHVCEVVNDNFTLTAGVNSYTYGDGGAFDATRPIKIVSAYLRDGNDDYPLTVGVLKEQAMILNKTLPSRPCALYYAQEYPNGVILFDYVPDKNYVLFMHAWKPILTVRELDTDIVLPVEYNRPLIFNLSVDLGPRVNQKVAPEVIAIATQSLEWITHVNGNPAPVARFDQAILGRGRSNIITGESS